MLRELTGIEPHFDNGVAIARCLLGTMSIAVSLLRNAEGGGDDQCGSDPPWLNPWRERHIRAKAISFDQKNGETGLAS